MNTSAAERFIRRLARLDVAERMTLKAAAGRAPQPDVAVFDAFTGAFWPIRTTLRRDACLLVATLYPWHPASGGRGNLGVTLHRAAAKGGQVAQFERLFEELLATSFPRLYGPLFDAVQMLASARVPVDWAALLDDLGRWDRPIPHQELSVQDAWASSWIQYGSENAD